MALPRILPSLLLLMLLLSSGIIKIKVAHSFTNQPSTSMSTSTSTSLFQKRSSPTRQTLFMSLENNKDDTKIASSSSSSSSPTSTPTSSSCYDTTPQGRLHRSEQIEKIQGVWWTSEQKDQLVEIKSSYAIFDAPQKSYISSTSSISSMKPPAAVVYPLGGTEEIVTLRTFKLAHTTCTTCTSASADHDDPVVAAVVIPQWISSPTSKVSVQQRGGGGGGTAAASSSSSSTFLWERCKHPEEYWKSGQVIQGYEESLIALLASEGPHWSASPVDVLRACIQGVQGDNMELVSSMCRFSLKSSPSLSSSSSTTSVNIGRRNINSNSEAVIGLSNYFASTKGVPSWSIVKCHYFFPDVCTLRVKIGTATTSGSNNSSSDGNKSFEFCLSREKKKKMKKANRTTKASESESSPSNKLHPSLLFDSIMDVELLVNGKTWAIDHIHACSSC